VQAAPVQTEAIPKQSAICSPHRVTTAHSPWSALPLDYVLNNSAPENPPTASLPFPHHHLCPPSRQKTKPPHHLPTPLQKVKNAKVHTTASSLMGGGCDVTKTPRDFASSCWGSNRRPFPTKQLAFPFWLGARGFVFSRYALPRY
jgi:hypothetical protein